MKGEVAAELPAPTISVPKQLKKYTRILRERSSKISNETEALPEYDGEFLLLNTRGRYQPYYVVINYQDCTLTYYANEKRTTEIEKLRITFFYIQELNSVDKIVELNAKLDNFSCKYRAYIWANNKVYNFSTKTNDEFSMWVQPINQLATCFSAGQLDIKRKAYEAVLPIQESQERYVVLNYIQLMNTLERTILFSNRIRKSKQGYLSVKIDELEESKEYYVYLANRFLHVCELSDKKFPIFIISLKYLNSIELNDNSFVLTSPLITATFFARHAVDAKDWVSSIKAPLSARNPSHIHEIFEDNTQKEEVDTIPVKDYYLNYKALGFFGKKKKVHKLKNGVTIVGRSSRNKVCLKDKKLSRNHFKIELEPGKAPLLSDLGSTFGTMVNNNPITSFHLNEGDSILVGSSIITITCN